MRRPSSPVRLLNFAVSKICGPAHPVSLVMSGQHYMQTWSVAVEVTSGWSCMPPCMASFAGLTTSRSLYIPVIPKTCLQIASAAWGVMSSHRVWKSFLDVILEVVASSVEPFYRVRACNLHVARSDHITCREQRRSA